MSRSFEQVSYASYSFLHVRESIALFSLVYPVGRRMAFAFSFFFRLAAKMVGCVFASCKASASAAFFWIDSST